jgi:hypothetical protein
VAIQRKDLELRKEKMEKKEKKQGERTVLNK